MKFIIETYGCQMNVSDSELVSSILIAAGWDETREIAEADLILLNTCSIRQHAEDKVWGRISNEKHRKLLKPQLKIGVLGCMAQRVGKGLLEKGSGVDFVVGVDQYQALPTILAEEQGFHTDFDFGQIYPGCQPKHQSKTSAFVTIMRGCDNFCSYCIVPYVRGRERSRAFQEIYEEVSRCVDSGMKDITLLGQNVNSYHYNSYRFPDLLRELDKIESEFRLRFITSHPKDLSDELIQALASCAKVCNHIHLPLQSGDNEVLAAMNRAYSIEHYMQLVDKLRKEMPDIAISTDLIAGFPGETEEKFENTIAALRAIRFDHAFCFNYSERDGTKALSLPDPVPEPVKLLRLQRMIDIQREITLKKFSAQIGKTVEVYVETLSRRSASQVSGKTRDFKIAVLNGTVADIGRLKSATVTRATSGTLICD